MPSMQFSLRHLLVAVACVAVACTALLNANPWWVRGSWLVAIGLLFLAVVQALFRKGERRAFWTGFAIAGWLCFVAGTNAFDGLRIVRQVPSRPWRRSMPGSPMRCECRSSRNKRGGQTMDARLCRRR